MIKIVSRLGLGPIDCGHFVLVQQQKQDKRESDTSSESATAAAFEGGLYRVTVGWGEPPSCLNKEQQKQTHRQQQLQQEVGDDKVEVMLDPYISERDLLSSSAFSSSPPPSSASTSLSSSKLPSSSSSSSSSSSFSFWDELHQRSTGTVATTNPVVVSVDLCFIETASSLASSLWPASLAGSIISCSPSIHHFIQNRTVLELGCGLGLMGQTIAPYAQQCFLTDHDQEILALVENQVSLHNNQNHGSSVKRKPAKVNTLTLDWRTVYMDQQQQQQQQPPSDLASTVAATILPQEGVDVIIGSDVAYYHHLVRPLMDTAQNYRKQNDHPSLCLIIGQANRACQWDLYHQITEGGYNQYTDERTGPWPGTTKMLLYHLYLSEWVQVKGDNTATCSSISSNSSTSRLSPTLQHGCLSSDDVAWEKVPLEGILPIAVLMHQSPGLELDPITPYDIYATQEVEDGLSMSF